MDDKKIANSLFSEAKKAIPNSTELAFAALQNSKFETMPLEELKSSFSEAVSTLQIDAYNLYLQHEKQASEQAINTVFEPLISRANSNEQSLKIFASHFGVLDKFSLSLTQSRRSRAGTAFEVIVSELFSRLGYPYTAQPAIGGSTPDYVLPSTQWYQRYPSDSIIFTLKRTLRERWRQIVTESGSGKFYLATIDEKVSAPGLEQMMKLNITLVVPVDVKSRKYSDKLNVISFEDFFEDHLDPAMARWSKAGAL